MRLTSKHKKQSEDPNLNVPQETSRREDNIERLSKEIDVLTRVLAEEKARSADYLNRLKYLQADFENLQKRTKRDSDEAISRANERLVARLLIILDDMEIALKVSSDIENSQVVRSGFELILGKLRDILKDEGLARIEAAGRPFDPSFHEATDQTLKDDAPDGMILEELKAGYTLKGKVLRPSIVTVVKNVKEPPSEEAGRNAATNSTELEKSNKS